LQNREAPTANIYDQNLQIAGTPLEENRQMESLHELIDVSIQPSSSPGPVGMVPQNEHNVMTVSNIVNNTENQERIVILHTLEPQEVFPSASTQGEMSQQRPEIVLHPAGLVSEVLLNPLLTTSSAHCSSGHLTRLTVTEASSRVSRPGKKTLDRAESIYLKNVSKWILRMGGMTFLCFTMTVAIYFIVLSNNLHWAVFTALKLECLLSLLAWHWISVSEPIREGTDELFLAGIKRLFTIRIWPVKFRAWAQDLQV